MVSFTPVVYRTQPMVISTAPPPTDPSFHHPLTLLSQPIASVSKSVGLWNPLQTGWDIFELHTDLGRTSCDPDAEGAVTCCQQNHSKQICSLAVLAPRNKFKRRTCELRVSVVPRRKQG